MSVIERIKGHLNAWRRIVLLSRRPDEEEFALLTRLTLIGFLLVGVIAYVIHLIYVMLVS